jgi:hypothetical protein
MWSQEDFPTGYIPWQLLIRARYAHEVDAVVGSVIVQTVQGVASREVAVAVSRAANAAVVGPHDQKIDAEHALSAMSALADFDDWCGTPWPHWRGPRPHGFEGVEDPISSVVLSRAADLVGIAGSEALQKSLGGLLGELAVGQH